MQILKIIFALSCALSLACSITKVKHSKELKSISINFHYPEKLSKDVAEILDVDVYMSFYDKYIVYQLPYHQTNSINNLLDYDSLKYSFFIQNIDSALGYKLQNINDSLGTKAELDITTAQLILRNVNFEDIFKLEKLSTENKIIDTIQNIDTYYFNDIKYDSARFSYTTKLTGIPFTFSPTLDSVHHKKLFRVELFTKKDTSVATRNLKDFHIISWEMKQVKIKNESEIIDLIERVKSKENI